MNEKIKSLQLEILGLEMEMNLLEKDIILHETNLAWMEKTRDDLIYTIDLHKKKGTIPVIKEYEKARHRLKVMTGNISVCKRSIEKCKGELDSMEESMAKKMEEHEEIRKEINKGAVVIPFNR